VTFRSPKLLRASKDQVCVRCGKTQGVVGAHYTGVRRLKLGGGYGIKVHDFLTADLCPECHTYMDTLSREKEKRYGHSEEFLYYIALTWERRFLQGTIVVARSREPFAPPMGSISHLEEVPLGEASLLPLLHGDAGQGNGARVGSEAAPAVVGEEL
jgi:hypothetical protein